MIRNKNTNEVNVDMSVERPWDDLADSVWGSWYCAYWVIVTLPGLTETIEYNWATLSMTSQSVRTEQPNGSEEGNWNDV